MSHPVPPHHILSGPAGAPLLVLGPSLGTSTRVWSAQLPSLARTFRVACFDLPGHGGSATTPPPTAGADTGTDTGTDTGADTGTDTGAGATTVEDLAGPVLALADRLGYERFHYAGISLGGAIGARLAADHPGRVSSLALICSSARFGPPEPWRERASLVRSRGMEPVVATAPGRWFAGPETAGTPLGRALLRDLATADPAGYAACCDALATCDLRPVLGRITAPTLVVGGSRDTATPGEHARELGTGIPRATVETIGTGHLALEEPRAVTELLLAHLDRSTAPSR
ncbi:alpha/beta fold hydrolase [Streptomyces sp. NPDC000594]|uniref:alpha/beta fold hydrolase n=1 Tax=Streptomyces sp. NPDC000594 TaxID=3154261 RepID=UPI00332F095C